MLNLNPDALRTKFEAVVVSASKPANDNSGVVTQVPVTEAGITFVEAVKQKRARLMDIDDWVEAWHTNANLTTKSLREYLGFSQELYAAWMRSGPDALIALME